MKKINVGPIIETIVAVILFLSMLFACGKYIDIKINGKSSSLPEIPQKDMQILMQTVPSINVAEKNTLAEPVSVGIKTGKLKLMAYTREARQSLLDYARLMVVRCFSGESTEIEFESESALQKYLSGIFSDNDYMFFGFYSDLPSPVFLPCLARDYESKDTKMNFNVQNLFLLPDDDGNLYGIAVDSDKKVNILVPDEKHVFNPSDYDAYNDIAGFAEFDFEGANALLPVFSVSIEQNNHAVNLACDKYGIKTDADWIINTMDVFRLNKNFSKTFVSRDNSLIDFIDDTNELVFSDDGSVKYNNNSDGLKLYDLLSYSASGASYAFPDKVLAVKRLFNMIDYDVCGKDANLGITDVYYDKYDGTLYFELKYFVSGIAVTDKQYDAFVSINGDDVTHVYFDALVCERLETTSMSLPQKYAFFSDGEQEVVCHYRLLSESVADTNEYSTVFAVLTKKQEGR